MLKAQVTNLNDKILYEWLQVEDFAVLALIVKPEPLVVISHLN